MHLVLRIHEKEPEPFVRKSRHNSIVVIAGTSCTIESGCPLSPMKPFQNYYSILLRYYLS